MKLVAATVATFCLSPAALGEPLRKRDAQIFDLRPDQLSFRYQENLEPYGAYECTREKSDVGLYEWDVFCKEGNVKHAYSVHLVVSLYPRTQYGKSAYEILYWVTDRTSAREPVFSSTTVWVHNSTEENRARVLELAQGIENDQSSLWLTIDLKE